jgi:hypothetical protein
MKTAINGEKATFIAVSMGSGDRIRQTGLQVVLDPA